MAYIYNVSYFPLSRSARHSEAKNFLNRYSVVIIPKGASATFAFTGPGTTKKTPAQIAIIKRYDAKFRALIKKQDPLIQQILKDADVYGRMERQYNPSRPQIGSERLNRNAVVGKYTLVMKDDAFRKFKAKMSTLKGNLERNLTRLRLIRQEYDSLLVRVSNEVKAVPL